MSESVFINCLNKSFNQPVIKGLMDKEMLASLQTQQLYIIYMDISSANIAWALGKAPVYASPSWNIDQQCFYWPRHTVRQN